MKKIKLQLDALAVASFETAALPADMGTVAGYEATPYCVVTGGIDSCWCSEYNTCDCTVQY